MSKVFSRQTLQKFEDASASIVLRQIDRAFQDAHIRLGRDPGGSEGDRRTQFRRYVASVNQHDPQQLDRLGIALGALIAAAASSKEDFLVGAARSDGFVFVDGAFRPAESEAGSFAVTRAQDLASIDDRARQLHLLASDRPKEAIDGAKELVESVCRTLLSLIGKPAPRKTAGLVDIAKSTLKVLDPAPARIDGECLQQLVVLVGTLSAMRSSRSASPRHARLAVGAAATFAGFVAETYAGSR
ncbi:MAG: hypothetical protein WAK11_12545 [Candidatus Cybelea sp.]